MGPSDVIGCKGERDPHETGVSPRITYHVFAYRSVRDRGRDSAGRPHGLALGALRP